MSNISPEIFGFIGTSHSTKEAKYAKSRQKQIEGLFEGDVFLTINKAEADRLLLFVLIWIPPKTQRNLRSF